MDKKEGKLLKMKSGKLSIRIPLFWKFAIISTIVVIIFGAVNIFLLWSSVYQSFEQEIDKRCKVLAKIVAEKSLDPIVYDNSLSLNNILNEVYNSVENYATPLRNFQLSIQYIINQK